MTNKGFLDITQIHLPKSCAVAALDWMFNRGQNGVEAVALWAGIREGDEFFIKRTIIPQQRAGNLEEGLIYVVDGQELHRISLELYDSGMQLFAQVHSHPNEAYHSDTDDAYPIVTCLGGMSVVVPDFARGGLNIDKWAVYRFLPGSKWTALNKKQKASFIQIQDDLPEPPFTKTKPFKFCPWH